MVAIADGDTLTVLDAADRWIEVRLAEVDAPEAGQPPHGDRAEQALAALVSGKPVRVEAEDSDRHGRPIGRVRAGAADVNAGMVRQGAAWVFRRYSQNPALLRLEAEAQAARRGVWALPEARFHMARCGLSRLDRDGDGVPCEALCRR